MTPLASFTNQFLSLGTVLLSFVVLVLFAGLVTRQTRLLSPFRRNAYFISFLIALSGLIVSLFYSNVIGYPPCNLCWWQRVFLYPQVIILGVALWKRDRNVTLTSLILSLMGGAVALYNTYLQFGGTSFIPCPATGPSCAQRYFLNYGFVTIPTMSLVGFLTIILLMTLVLRERENS